MLIFALWRGKFYRGMHIGYFSVCYYLHVHNWRMGVGGFFKINFPTPKMIPIINYALLYPLDEFPIPLFIKTTRLLHVEKKPNLPCIRHLSCKQKGIESWSVRIKLPTWILWRNILFLIFFQLQRMFFSQTGVLH